MPLAVVACASFLLFAPSGTPAADSSSGAAIVRVIDAGTMNASAPIEGWSSKRPSLADVDGDGVPEILAQNENERVYVIDARSGRALAELQPSLPGGKDIGPFNGPKAADLDGDGSVEIVNVNRDAVVSVWRVTGPVDEATGRLPTERAWEVRLDDYHGWPTADAGPVLADLNGDGALEIVAQTEERGAFALRHNGTLHWKVDAWGGNAEAVAKDVDDDGDLDAVFFTDGGRVYAVDGPTGEVLWSFEGRDHGAWPGSIASSGAVADVDADGVMDAVACLRNVENATTESAPGAPQYAQHHFWLMATRAGELLWKAKPSWGNPLCSAYTIAHDADGDGSLELFGMDWDTIGHKPGAWARTHDPSVFAFNADGSERWHATVDAWNAKAHVALADWDADGDQDVVAYDTRNLVVFDAATGERVDTIHLDGWRVKQGPLFTDLEGDGRLQAIVAVQDKSHAFLVIDVGPVGAPPAWPGWEAPAWPAEPYARTAPDVSGEEESLDRADPGPAGGDEEELAFETPAEDTPPDPSADGHPDRDLRTPPAPWPLALVLAIALTRGGSRQR